jgi:hypothetical protein
MNDASTSQSRAESPNVLNMPQFGLPADNPDVPSGASITSTTNDNRESQFAPQVIFSPSSSYSGREGDQ